MLDWFDAVDVYPKFYWLSRDQETEICAFGEAKHFTHLVQAQKDIEAGRKVLGIQYFNDRAIQEANQHFFIPRLFLLREKTQYQILANISDDAQDLIDIIDALPVRIIPKILAPCVISDPVHEPNLEQWEQIIDEATGCIRAKQIKKVVLARKTTLRFEAPLDVCALLKASKEVNNGHYHFIFALSNFKAFVGSSPERLYKRDKNALKTEALAGTVKRGVTPEQDLQLSRWLLQDAKTKDENKIVASDIKNSLATMVDAFHVEDECELVSLSRVQHLRRKIEATLTDGVCDQEILQRLQPTAAIAGMPRNKALKFIADFETFPRKWYAGALGHIDKGSSEFCVTLRSVLIEGHEAHFYAGAGIVEDSEAKTEWQEFNHKVSTMMRLVSQYPLSRRNNE